MSGRRVAICTPMRREPTADFVMSLFPVLQNFPAETKWIQVQGHANLPRARNYLVLRAREWGATDIVFIDDDVGFEPDALIALFENTARVVAGCPQRRTDELGFCGVPDVPIAKLMGNLITGNAATAFMRIEAGVFDELQSKVPAYLYNGETTPAYFQTPIAGGDLLDEDIFFSRLCRTNGIDVWLDPTIALRHWHSKPLTEVMANHLQFSPAPVKEAANG